MPVQTNTGKEREKTKLKNNGRIEGAGLTEVSTKEKVLSVIMSTKFVYNGPLLKLCKSKMILKGILKFTYSNINKKYFL